MRRTHLGIILIQHSALLGTIVLAPIGQMVGNLCLHFAGHAPSSMNYLAHAFLAGPQPASRLGGSARRFRQGTDRVDCPALPARSRQRHRAAPAHRQLRRPASGVPPQPTTGQRAAPAFFGRDGDLFYDHFLARHWSVYCAPPPLEAFTRGVLCAADGQPDAAPRQGWRKPCRGCAATTG